MRKIIFYFLILLASIWLGVKIHASSGYVLLAYKTYTLETTLWVAVIAILVTFFLCYFLLRLASGISNTPKRIRTWWANYTYKKSHSRFIKGMQDIAEGNWRSAEKKLLRAAKNKDIAMLNYLAAAISAQQQQAFDRRDEYLGKAESSNKNAKLAIGLTQARLHIANQQWERALAVLQNLRQIKPKHVLLLQLLQQVYVALHDWKSLKDLLPVLLRRKVLRLEDFYKLEQVVYEKLLQALLDEKNYFALEKTWKKMPWRLQWNAKLLVIYLNYLLTKNFLEKAETLLIKALRKNWDDILVERFGMLHCKNPIKQLKIAEGWYKSHEHDQTLLLCLARLCKRQKLWGKARFYLEKSLKLAPSAEIYHELGQIMEEQGEKNAAFNYYKMAASVIPTTAAQ